jgi:hypothetical protein
MAVLTKTALEIFEPVDSGGGPRGADMSEVQVWGTEVERGILNYDHENTNIWFQPPVLAEEGGIGASPDGTDYFNIVIAPGARSVGDGAHIWRSTLIGEAAGEYMEEFERVEGFGSGAFRFAKYAQRCTGLGSITMSWLGQPKSALKALTHDLFEPVSPDEEGWDAFGLETDNPGIAAKLMAVDDAANTDDVRGNVAVGRDSILHLIRGIFNTAVGYRSLTHSFYVSNCVAVGRDALANNVLGDQNTALGSQAGRGHQEGSNNIYLGYGAGADHITGVQSIFIGYGTGIGWSAGNRCILIGPEAGYNITPSNDALVIQNDDERAPLIGGDFSVPGVVINGTPSQAIYPLRVISNTPVTGTANSSADDFVIECGNQNGGLTIRTSNSTIGTAYFGDPEANSAGGMSYDHSTDILRLRASGTNVVQITSNSCRVLGHYILTDGITAPSATSGQAKIYVDTADGDLKIIFGDGTVKTIVTD